MNSDGFKADPEYVRAIIDMKPPTTSKELQSLIGCLVWIRQFIETRLSESIRTDMFSNLMAPINELNKPGWTFVWTEGANKAFNKIKKRLASPPIISFPDFTGLFTLTTDASDIACGAILMQENKHGQKKIIAVASHTFNATERNWSTTEREAYAIKWAITKFDYFLRSRPFVVLTDHRSLTYLDQREFNNAKIRQWQEEISCYKFVLEYVEGESNVWADMLSRRYGHSKDKLTADPTPAGKRFKLQGSSLNIYVPSWCMDEIKSSQLLPGTHTTRNIQHHLQAIDAFLAFHATSTIPVEEIADHMGIAAEQASDDTLSKIIRALQLATQDRTLPYSTPKIIVPGYITSTMHQFYLEPGTSVLMIRDTTNTPKLVVPYKLRTKYLHQAHDCVNHSGISACRNTYPATGGSSKIAISGRMFSHAKPALTQGKLRHAPKLVHRLLQERRKTIRGCLHRFCLNAPLKGQAVHPYYSRQLQPPPHGPTMCQRPRNRRSPRTLPVLSSSPRDSPHCLLRPRNPLHW